MKRYSSAKKRYKMTKVFISPDKKQFKANLHCHSTLSDGKLTPEELKEAYKREGYDVLSITDHCVPAPHNDLTDKDFLLLTGYEAYIRPGQKGKYNQFGAEIHMNLFARDKDNDKIICFDERYCKYIKDPEKREALNKVGPVNTREYTPEFINYFVKTAKENGYIVSYNHPFWSMEDAETVMQYEGFFSLELENTSSYVINSCEHAEELYDRMLRAGMHYGCHGADDNHNKAPFGEPDCDSFGAHTMILADDLEYGEIFEALENHEFYESNGPRINALSVNVEPDPENPEANITTVHVECSEAARIILFYGSKSPKSLFARNGESVSLADLVMHPKAKYFRVVVVDKDGKKACSRGYFTEEFN